MRRKTLTKIIALTLCLLTVSTAIQPNTGLFDSSLMIESTKAYASTTSVGTYTDSQNVNYTLYDDGTAEVAEGTSSTAGSIPNSDTIVIPSEIIKNGVTYKVTKLGALAFYCNTSIRSVTLPDTIETLGTLAFYKCSALEYANIPSKAKVIEDTVFYECKLLKSIDLPSTLVSVGKRAFYHCDSVESVRVPSSLSVISESMFDNCKSLKHVELPNTISSIGYCAFRACNSLESITIPSSVTSIDALAFGFCTGLRYVELPDSVTTLNSSAFQSSAVEVIKANKSVVAGTVGKPFSYRVYLYNKDISNVVASYQVVSGVNLTEYANKVGIGWSNISGSSLDNIVCDSEFICTSLVQQKTAKANLVTDSADVVKGNREYLTITIK